MKNLAKEDLQWELDNALEKGNERRAKALLRELDRREVTSTVK